MIEETILNYLKENMDCPCTMVMLPDDEKYVLLERTSGSLYDKANSVTVAIQSYANSLYDAALLNEEVKKVMLNIEDIESIGSVSLNSDYNFTDTTTKKYRYQAVFNIVYV